MVDELFELAKLEAQEGVAEKKPVYLQDLFEHLKIKYELDAKDKGVELEVLYAEDLPEIQGDSKMLDRAFSNLIENAIRYTLEGGEVEVSAVKKDDSVIVQIKDSGIGIPEKDLPYIFDNFYRSDHAKLKRIEGSGLGLSIVQKIIEAHDASITVDSEINKGTLFEVILRV